MGIEKPTIIYCATNKLNGKQYIGITNQGLKRRIQAHCSDSKAAKNPFMRALNKYGVEGFQWEILETTDTRAAACRREIELISQMCTMTPEGYNATIGGEGVVGFIRTEEWSRKVSQALTGRHHSEETRKKISAAQIGKPGKRLGKKLTEEQCAAMSKSRKGRPFTKKRVGASEETKRKISESKKGKKQSPETIAKRALSHIGKKQSEAAKEKISAAHKGRVHTEQSRKNMSDAHKGQKPSAETLAKRSESLKRAWARRKEAKNG